MRSAPRGMMPRSRQRSQRYPGVGRPRRGHARLRHAAAGLARAHADGGQLAHPSLARPHRGGGVALEGFDVVEALVDRVHQILRAHIRAQTDERALARRVALRRQRGRRDERFTGHLAYRADVGGKICRNEGALLRRPTATSPQLDSADRRRGCDGRTPPPDRNCTAHREFRCL